MGVVRQLMEATPAAACVPPVPRWRLPVPTVLLRARPQVSTRCMLMAWPWHSQEIDGLILCLPICRFPGLCAVTLAP